MKTKITAIFLAVIICLGFTACKEKPKEYGENSEIISGEDSLADVIITPESIPETSSESEESVAGVFAPKVINSIPGKELLTSDFEEISALASDQVPWGPGTNFNSEGRPIACVDLQKKYGGYASDFVRLGSEFDGKVFLTFDEGYENGFTGAILDVLKEKNVCAVFFVTLSYVKSEPELVQRMIDEGHIVGNHTARHPNMTTISTEDCYNEIADLHNYMHDNFDYDMYLFRFPEGAFSEQNIALLQKLGYKSVFWSFAYKDWDANAQPEEEKAFSKITGSLHSGEIFLLHAVSETNANILGRVIDTVREQGYSFEVYEQ